MESLPKDILQVIIAKLDPESFLWVCRISKWLRAFMEDERL